MITLGFDGNLRRNLNLMTRGRKLLGQYLHDGFQAANARPKQTGVN
jgi:hypothetical protein